MMRILLGVSVACLISMSMVATDIIADVNGPLSLSNISDNIFTTIQAPDVNTNSSNVGSVNMGPVMAGNDSFKSYNVNVDDSFNTEGNTTNIGSGNTVDSVEGNSNSGNGNVANNDGNAIGNEGNGSGNVANNDNNTVGNEGNNSGNVAGNDGNVWGNEGNGSGNVFGNNNNIFGNNGNVINP